MSTEKHGALDMTYLAAAIQMSTGRDKAANLEKAERMIRLAAARGARGVQLARQACRGSCGEGEPRG